jgi:putative ABC transport system permease protein
VSDAGVVRLFAFDGGGSALLGSLLGLVVMLVAACAINASGIG